SRRSDSCTSASRPPIRSTFWAADLAPAGPPLFAVEEIDATRAHLIETAMGHEADLVAARFARGCRCFAVISDGAIAGYGWLSTGPEWVGELQLEIRPGAGEGLGSPQQPLRLGLSIRLARHRNHQRDSERQSRIALLPSNCVPQNLATNQVLQRCFTTCDNQPHLVSE